jgi:hypothetical protein
VDSKYRSSWGGWCSSDPIWAFYGRILRGFGGSFVVVPDLRWETAPRSDSDMIFGVGIRPP